MYVYFITINKCVAYSSENKFLTRLLTIPSTNLHDIFVIFVKPLFSYSPGSVFKTKIFVFTVCNLVKFLFSEVKTRKFVVFTLN